MTISAEQVEVAAREVDDKTPPKVSHLADGTVWFIFNKLSVPGFRLMMIKKAPTHGLYNQGEAVALVKNNDGQSNMEFGTGNQYDDLPKEMFQ